MVHRILPKCAMWYIHNCHSFLLEKKSSELMYFHSCATWHMNERRDNFDFDQSFDCVQNRDHCDDLVLDACCLVYHLCATWHIVQ